MEFEKTIKKTKAILEDVVKLADDYSVEPILVWDIMQAVSACGSDYERGCGCQLKAEDNDLDNVPQAEDEEDYSCEAEERFCNLRVMYENQSTDSKGRLKLPRSIVSDLVNNVKAKGDGKNAYVFKDELTGEIHIDWQPKEKDFCYKKVLVKNIANSCLISVKRMFGTNANDITVELYNDGEILIY